MLPRLGERPAGPALPSQPPRRPGDEEEDLLESASRERAQGHRRLAKERMDGSDGRRYTENRGPGSTEVLGGCGGVEPMGVEERS